MMMFKISSSLGRPLTQRGFTLIELMISLLVVGVLLAIAYPSFMDQMRKSRRGDAIAALTGLQQAQERWRATHQAYAGFNTAADGEAPNGLKSAASSAAGYYGLTIGGLSANQYTLVAAAAQGKSQSQDGDCQRLGVRARDGVLRFGSGASSIDWSATNPDAGGCWAR